MHSRIANWADQNNANDPKSKQHIQQGRQAHEGAGIPRRHCHSISDGISPVFAARKAGHINTLSRASIYAYACIQQYHGWPHLHAFMHPCIHVSAEPCHQPASQPASQPVSQLSTPSVKFVRRTASQNLLVRSACPKSAGPGTEEAVF